MPAISICTCQVSLSEDTRQVVFRGPTRPVTWPEIDVLLYLHGPDAVSDITVIDTKETTVPEEFERLQLRYGAAAVAQLFPGKRPAMQLEAPPDVPRAPGAEPEPEPAPKKAPGRPRKSTAKAAEPDPVDNPFEAKADD